MKPKNRKVLEDYQFRGGSTVSLLAMPSTFAVKPLHRSNNNSSSSPSLTGPSKTAANNLNPTHITQSFDSSMALTILVLLTAIFFMGFFSIYLRCFNTHFNSVHQHLSRRRRNNQQQQQTSSSSMPATSGESSSSDGLDPITIGSLPLLSYFTIGRVKQQQQQTPLECVVCLGEFENTEIVKMIPYCEHFFHPQCIDTWFLSHSSCPICRSTKLFVLHSFSSNNSVNKIKEVDESCLIGSSSSDQLDPDDQRLDDDHLHQRIREFPEKSTGIGDHAETEVVVERVLLSTISSSTTMRRTLSCSSILENRSSMVLLNSQLRRSSSSRFF